MQLTGQSSAWPLCSPNSLFSLWFSATRMCFPASAWLLVGTIEVMWLGIVEWLGLLGWLVGLVGWLQLFQKPPGSLESTSLAQSGETRIWGPSSSFPAFPLAFPCLDWFSFPFPPSPVESENLVHPFLWWLSQNSSHFHYSWVICGFVGNITAGVRSWCYCTYGI